MRDVVILFIHLIVNAVRLALVPRQNLIRSKNSSISLFPIAKRLNTMSDGNEEFVARQNSVPATKAKISPETAQRNN